MQANDDPLLEAVRGLGHFEKLRSTFPSHEIREVVAHHVRDVGVAGSNPATPTNKYKHMRIFYHGISKLRDRYGDRNPYPQYRACSGTTTLTW
jgi:hypothetical protein